MAPVDIENPRGVFIDPHEANPAVRRERRGVEIIKLVDRWGVSQCSGGGVTVTHLLDTMLPFGMSGSWLISYGARHGTVRALPKIAELGFPSPRRKE